MSIQQNHNSGIESSVIDLPMFNGLSARQRMTNGNSSLRVGVIGGGPGGLAAAARLAEAGVSVDLFEGSNELGGLARSFSLWGRQLELSAHIFRSKDEFVNRLWRDCAGELEEISLRRGIFDGQSVVEYPITPLRILRNLGTVDTARSVAGLGLGRLFQQWSSEPESAEDWMVRTYGRPLHERFLRDYAEKLWGMPCNEISASFPQFLFQSADDSQDGKQTFLYPKRGNSSVWNKLGEYLEELGVSIHLNTRVGELDVDDNTVRGLVADGERYEFDHVISTMPMGLLARLVLPMDLEINSAAAALRARSTVLVYLRAEAEAPSDFNWLSVYPASYRMGRITDFGNWLDTNDGSTIYCLEFWCDRSDDLWDRSDDELVKLAAAELNRTKLVGDVSVMDGHVKRVLSSHPVFSIASAAAINTINARLDSVSGLSSVGRHGAHGVHGMGESMEAARFVADQIVNDVPIRKAPVLSHTANNNVEHSSLSADQRTIAV